MMQQVDYGQQFAQLVAPLGEVTPKYAPVESDESMNSRVLWLLVIRQALFDFIKWRRSKVLKRRRIAEDAQAWLFDNSVLNNSLERVCELVGLQVELVRQTALSMSPKDVKKMEIQERENKLKAKQTAALVLTARSATRSLRGKRAARAEQDECDGDDQ